MFAFSVASEIALIDLNAAGNGRGLFHLLSNDLTQAVVKIGRRFAVHTKQIRSRAPRHASDKKFSQPILLFFR